MGRAGYRASAVMSLPAEVVVALAETPVRGRTIPRKFSRSDPLARFIRSPW